MDQTAPQTAPGSAPAPDLYGFGYCNAEPVPPERLRRVPLVRLGQGDARRDVHAEDLGEPLDLIPRGQAAVGAVVLAAASSAGAGVFAFLAGMAWGG